MKTIRDIIKSLDAIEIYNGEVLYSFAEFYEVLKNYKSGNAVELGVFRSQKEMKCRVVLK